MLRDIENKRRVDNKKSAIERWNTILWHIYEDVKYDKERLNSYEVDPWTVGVRRVYDSNYSKTPEYTEFVKYFEERGFVIHYDSLNNYISIKW
jgi:hypothetical protein